jgi:hypothetical protein
MRISDLNTEILQYGRLGHPSFPTPCPQARPDPPSSWLYFRAFMSYLLGGGGAGALLSYISDIFLSNIWRNEYYLADLSMI